MSPGLEGGACNWGEGGQETPEVVAVAQARGTVQRGDMPCSQVPQPPPSTWCRREPYMRFLGGAILCQLCL